MVDAQRRLESARERGDREYEQKYLKEYQKAYDEWDKYRISRKDKT